MSESDTENVADGPVDGVVDIALCDSPASAHRRLIHARKQCRLALDQLEAHERYDLCAELGEAYETIEEVLETVETLGDCDDDTPDTPQVGTDGGQPLDQPPSKLEQATERARDELTRQELTNMVYGLSGVCEILVDGDDEDWRPTTITVGFEDYRVTGDVGTIMRRQGWRFADAVFSPYNRITFVEPGADVDEVVR